MLTELGTNAPSAASVLGWYACTRRWGTVYTVDSALQHTCAGLREHAARGEITGSECDLLIDGAILLAVHLEAMVQDGQVARPPGTSRTMRTPAGQRVSRRRQRSALEGDDDLSEHPAFL